VVRIRERLYLTADRKRVVGENDRSGAFLFAKPGDEIEDDLAEKYGLTTSRQPKAVSVPVGRMEAAARRSEEAQVKKGPSVVEVLEGKTLEELLEMALKGNVELPENPHREEVVMAILKQSGHEKEAEELKKGSAENKMGSAPNKGGLRVPPEAKRR
jgi:hypothetical protein